MDILMSVTRLGDTVFGGDAKEFIREFLEQPISRDLSHQHVYFRPLQYSKTFQDELYSLGLKRQAEKQEHRFGGHKHQLAITKETGQGAHPAAFWVRIGCKTGANHHHVSHPSVFQPNEIA
jgi:hypothetical protein